MSIVGVIVGILIGSLLSGLVIWIVGKLGLGLEVSGYGAAFVVAVVIAVISNLLNWLLGVLGVTIDGGFAGPIIHLVIAAIMLMIGSSIVPGVRVKGFGGALIAAIVIAAIAWLISLALGAAMPA